ncbi:MAG: hypothetical protein QGG40_10990 [Myxococcota bacterium]|jgi:hypothetical protein|nr:hypothetical protein [Myxococcota bacterium]
MSGDSNSHNLVYLDDYREPAAVPEELGDSPSLVALISELEARCDEVTLKEWRENRLRERWRRAGALGFVLACGVVTWSFLAAA